MNPLFAMMVQLLQALGLYTVLQAFVIAILTLAVLFYALQFFKGR